MKLLLPVLLPWLVAFLSKFGAADPTWPSAIDELEDVMFLNTGFRSRGFGSFVTPCSASPAGTTGRNTASEWLRLGFHDMATTNVYFAPRGGIDASMAYELNDGENIGAGFATAFTTYSSFFNSRLSASDLVALGVYASVRACNGPVVPMRGGRVDATKAGSLGVPQPQNGIGTFSNQFARMGFNGTDMIKMVACGHAIGGVHAGNFPTIVAPGTAPDDYQLFVATQNFDNSIATRYLNGPDTDPLAVGISTSSGRNADFQVFNSDKNVTLKALTDAAYFNSQCSSIFQRMIETVDPLYTTLSPVIAPYEVKPSGLQLTLLSGSTMSFSGYIRVRTTVRSVSQISSVQLAYIDRNGAAGAAPIVATAAGTAAGFDDSFSFYSFSSNISTSTSISSFTILVNSQTYNNNGAGYPVQDSVIVQTPQSCLSGTNLTVVAAVRSTVTTPMNMTVTQKIKVAKGSPIPSPLPVLQSNSAIMTQGASLGPYTLYSVSYNVNSATGTKYGVSSGGNADAFKDVSDLGATCQLLAGGSSSSTSTSSTVSSTTSSISTSLNTDSSSTSVSTSTTSSLTSLKSSQSSTSSSTTSSTGTSSSGSTSSPSSTSSSASSTSGSTSSVTPSSSSISSTTTPGSSSSSSSQSSSTTQASSLSSTSSSATSSATLGVQSTIGRYTFQGCYTEASNGRALTSASYYDYNAMTLETCASNCSGFLYWGVEYGGECYCGNSLSSGSVLAATTDCSFTCPGNKVEYCGAGNRLQMYKLTAAGTSTVLSSATPTPTIGIVPSAGPYNYYGCYSEATSTRALGAATYNSDQQTVEKCAAACSPYLYAGLEYGRECYCANSFASGSVPKPDSDCSMPCAANSTEYCGAGNRLSVYIRNGTVPSGTSTSASSTPSPTGPVIKKSVGSYTYYGCQTEATNSRALTEGSYTSNTAMTLESCAQFCSGYAYFGTEYAQECYCGNSFATGSTSAPNSDCSFACTGDGTEFCGAGNRLSVYVLEPAITTRA